uniref:RING-type E3 ubiquitin transferase n=1 Tax=Geospiza parvula TaxID=87175 RepID=A0A8U8B1Q6_GEOPR
MWTAWLLSVLQAETPHNSENQMCPICLDIINNPVSVSWCSHAFCFPCILEWSRNRPVCPICRECSTQREEPSTATQI